MEKTKEQILKELPISVGQELETQTNIGIYINEEIINDPDAFAETSKIYEVHMPAPLISDWQSMAYYGEIVRIANFRYHDASSTKVGGSAHTHLNYGTVYDTCEDGWLDVNRRLVAEVIDNQLCGTNLCKLLPYFSVGYMKNYPKYIRDGYRNLRLDWVADRGTACQLNNGIDYASIGYEVRINENTPMWVYLIPLLDLLDNPSELSRYLSAYNTDEYAGLKDTFSDLMEATSKHNQQVLCDNIHLVASVINADDSFIELMQAYILGDNIKYMELLEGSLNVYQNNKIKQLKRVVADEGLQLESCQSVASQGCFEDIMGVKIQDTISFSDTMDDYHTEWCDDCNNSYHNCCCD